MSDNYSYVAEDEMLFSASPKSEPETCLGMHFDSAEDRREYFRNELRKKLKDPEFRAIEGFPIGEDEDIIALSDPPYYCACPNPWIPDFIREWESKKTPSTTPYKREPFATDVSEGKNNAIYNAHSYHTKVPPRAIMRYILHYTNPGDIIFDGFCGTGMTGVAAQMCSQKEEIIDAGYQIEKENIVLDKEKKPISLIGSRHVVLNDLSPIASNIAFSYNHDFDVARYSSEVERVFSAVENECSWMYQTKHTDGSIGKINFTVWSDVFVCPNCGGEVVFYNVAVESNGKVKKDFLCSSCGSVLNKKTVSKAMKAVFDDKLGEPVQMIKQVPVLINYSVGRKSFQKQPDADDLGILKRIESMTIPYWFPTDRMPEGRESRRNDNSGLTHVHHYYTKRLLYVLSLFLSKIKSPEVLLLFTSQLLNVSKLNSYSPDVSFPFNTLSGTLYVGSLISEPSLNYAYSAKKEKLKKINNLFDRNIISVSSSSFVNIPRNSVDYIFLDPPFGANLSYSELSFIWEAWLRIKTNNEEEAIESDSQGKGIREYRDLMTACFAEAFRILKPGHWMTVEFSNTDSAVWNSIQTSLAEVGFIIANVSALDKQSGSFKAVTTTSAVKQDLILSLYKPDESFEQQITTAVGTEAVWTFVRKHLDYLPLVKKQGETSITVPERDPRIIYDRMVSYFVGHNMLLPISSPDFLSEMPRRFVERGGLYYLPEQAQQYDKLVARQMIETANMETSLFVCDENSAIAWIRAQLKDKPMTLGEMTPLFMQELSSWTKGERKPELRELLEQNFLCYNGNEDVPSQVHAYLSTNFKDLRGLPKDNPALRDKGKGRWYIPDPNKAGDLEKIREKALLKEFGIYESSKGKIKEFRIEAIRAGFKKAWQEKNYALIKNICERMPSAVVEEDEKLLMWYSCALNRLGE